MHKENYPIAFYMRPYDRNVIFFMHMIVQLCKFIWIGLIIWLLKGAEKEKKILRVDSSKWHDDDHYGVRSDVFERLYFNLIFYERESCRSS